VECLQLFEIPATCFALVEEAEDRLVGRLAPHRSETWKLSKDPQFVAKVRDVGSLHVRHRAIEFKKFLATLDREVPGELDVHVILDNSSTHKTPAIQRWLLAHPRFVLHFTPTSSSWLNLVERWFSELTTKKLRRATHRSVQALNSDIRTWIDTWTTNQNPSSGPRPPTKSSTPSPATADESTTHDTSPEAESMAVPSGPSKHRMRADAAPDDVRLTWLKPDII
jgi:transposase